MKNLKIVSQPTTPKQRPRCSPNSQPNVEENITTTDPISILIRETNGEPFKQEDILNLRRLIFSAANANSDLCLLRLGMAEIYFHNENLANILIQKSNTLSFAGTPVKSKIVIKTADVWT